MSQQEYFYKLVKPFESNNVYKASSLISGAGKCFKEVLRAMPETKQFSILDINTNDIFDFNVNPPPISRELISPNVGLQDIKELRDKITNLEERLQKLEISKGISSEDNVILLGGQKLASIASEGEINNNQNNNNLSVKTLSQVNSMKINNNRNLINKLNNGQNLNVELARKLIN
jgi:hypothetical protein